MTALTDSVRALAAGLAFLLAASGAVAQQAEPAEPAALDSEAALAEADAAMNAGRADRAVALYSALLERPDMPVEAYPLLFVRRAAAFSTLGNAVEAMADFDTAVELSPDDPDIRFYRGMATLQAGDPDAALADLDLAVAGRPGNPAALAARGRVHYLRADLERARGDVEEALRLQPGNPLALAGRGEIALVQGRYRDALGDLNAAIESEPALLPAYRSRIAVSEALGDWDRVKSDLSRLLELGDRSPQLLAKAKSYGLTLAE